MVAGAPVARLVASAGVGTPAYVYDLDGIDAAMVDLTAAFAGDPHLVAYAVKANAAAPIVRGLAQLGAGADVVSAAELMVALGSGIAPHRIVWSGVAKTDAEIDRALTAGEVGIDAIHVESVEEILRVGERARALGRPGRVALRMKPGLDVETTGTHAHITTGHDEAKFGIAEGDVADAITAVRAFDSLALVGVTVHAGSQVTSVSPYLESAAVAFDVALGLPEDLRRSLRYIDTGGGFGIDYGEGCSVRPADFVKAVRAEKKKRGLESLELRVEPGRSLVGAFGVLVARVIQSKTSKVSSDDPTKIRRWLMIDAGMNDLMRPALYQARHRVVPLKLDPVAAPSCVMRVVGPVCESSDDFGDHELPLLPPETVALLDAGAYGFSMASQYNGRGLAAEVFARGGRVVAVSKAVTGEAWARARLAIEAC